MNYQELQTFISLKFLPFRTDAEYFASIPQDVKYKMVTGSPWSFFITADERSVSQAFALGARLHTIAEILNEDDRIHYQFVYDCFLKYLTQYYFENEDEL